MVMTGLPLTTPMVFSVGPGLSTTYGTGSMAPTTASARVRKPATIKVRARRDMEELYAFRPALIAGADPLRVAVGERLVLPDRHLALEIVDQPPAGLEGLAPVGGGRRDHDRDLTQAEVADPVDRRQGGHGEVGRHLLRPLPQALLGGGMGRVRQERHRPAAVLLPHRPDEDRRASRGVVADGAEHLVHGQRRVTNSQ